MDTDWFRKKMREAGATSQDVADAAGRARSGLSHIFSGKQMMTIHWARALAGVLDVPLDEVMARAGLLRGRDLAVPLRGMSEGDATVFTASARSETPQAFCEMIRARQSGVDVWEVKSRSLSHMGYMIGDLMLVDCRSPDHLRAGDVVVAQIYDQHGGARTVLRRYEPPVLVAASPDETDLRIHMVDGATVVVKGKVLASWRQAS